MKSQTEQTLIRDRDSALGICLVEQNREYNRKVEEMQ